jgi:hypothetical protein
MNKIYKLVFLLLLVFVSGSILGQSNKAKKTYEALQSKDFEKGMSLISELKEKNEEGTLIYFFQYQYYFSTSNPSKNLDSAYIYLKFAANQLKFETEKLRMNYLHDFALGTAVQNDFDLIYEQAFQLAKTKNTINDYNHFISFFGDNKYKPLSLSKVDTLQFEYYSSFHSIDSLYRFKTNFKDSKLHNNANDLIVDLKIKACEEKQSINCFEEILKEFPKTKSLNVIKLEIAQIKDSLAEAEFKQCKSKLSVECLQSIKNKYPGTKIIGSVDNEIDLYYFNYYTSSKNLDSISLFISNFPKSIKIDDAKSQFILVFEDQIKTLVEKDEVLDFNELKLKFYPLVLNYNSLEPRITRTKELVDSIAFKSIEFKGLEEYSWFVEKFPTSKHIIEIKEEISRQKSLNNVAFIIENPEYPNSKYGLLNMTTGSLNFGFFLEDVKGFSNDLAAVKYKGKWGYIDRSGFIMIPFIYDDANSFTTDITGVCENGVWYFIDEFGNPVSDKEYLKIGDFGDGLFNVKSFNGGWYYVNINEEVINKEGLYLATPFINGYAAASPSDGRIQILDTKLNVIKDGFEMSEFQYKYGDRGSYSNNIESFEYSEKLKKYIINSEVFYSVETNSSEIDNPATANDFIVNDLKFDETGQYLIDGRGIICYSSKDDKLDYSTRDGKIDVYFNLYGKNIHPIYPIKNYHYFYLANDSKWDNNSKTTYTLSNFGDISNSRRLIAFNRETILYQEDMGHGIKTMEGKDIVKNATFNGFSLFINGIAIVRSEAGAFLMNEQGQKLTKLYQSLERLNDHTFIAKMKNDTKYFLVNESDVALSAFYDVIEKQIVPDNLVVKNRSSQKGPCKEEYKIGLISISGKVIIPVVFDKLILVPNQVIVEEISSRQSSYGDYTCSAQFKIFNYDGDELEVIPPGYIYWQTDSQNTTFQNITYKPNSSEIIKRLIIQVPIFIDARRY